MRTSYLVAYDISDDKRLRQVFKIMRGFGGHLQYSVFECQLTPTRSHPRNGVQSNDLTETTETYCAML